MKKYWVLLYVLFALSAPLNSGYTQGLDSDSDLESEIDASESFELDTLDEDVDELSNLEDSSDGDTASAKESTVTEEMDQLSDELSEFDENSDDLQSADEKTEDDFAEEEPSNGEDEQFDELLTEDEPGPLPSVDEEVEPMETQAVEPVAPIETEEIEVVDEIPEPEVVTPTYADSSTNLAPIEDLPNEDYEKKLNEIYETFYKEPLTSAEWSGITGSRLTETYEIQRGDSLWGVSDVFFGDGFYWAKVWSVNQSIENPHLIEPGNSIRFQLGNEEDLPSFVVTQTDNEFEQDKASYQATPKADGGTYFEEEEDIDIPPPIKKPQPVVLKLPPSLPGLTPSISDEYADAGIAYDPRKVLKLKDAMDIDYFISDKPIGGIGQVIEIELGTKGAGPFQYLFVEIRNGAARVGDNYKVIRTVGTIVVPKDIPLPTRVPGYANEVLGEVELVDEVESSVENVQVFRAMVTRALYPVPIAAKLVDGSIQREEITKGSGELVYIDGQIIGGKQSLSREVFSKGSLVYINRGSNQNILPGYIMPLRTNRKMRFKKSIIDNDKRRMGYLKIVDVAKNYATGIIIESADEIRVGDYFGDPTYIAPPPVDVDTGEYQMEQGQGVVKPEFRDDLAVTNEEKELQDLEDLEESEDEIKVEAENKVSPEDDFEDADEDEFFDDEDIFEDDGASDKNSGATGVADSSLSDDQDTFSDESDDTFDDELQDEE